MSVTIVHTDIPDVAQLEFLFALWNKEYPAKLSYKSMSELMAYLNPLTNPMHYFAMQNGEYIGWAFSFSRDLKTNFAVIVDSAHQNTKVGTMLLNRLKSEHSLLYGWVIDHNHDKKLDGESYRSPMAFYLKNGFTILPENRLETPVISAVQIQWSQS